MDVAYSAPRFKRPPVSKRAAIAGPAEDRYFARAVPMFRSRNHFRVPSLKIGPVIFFIVAAVLIGGLAVLAVIDPSPTVKHFEVPVTKG